MRKLPPRTRWAVCLAAADREKLARVLALVSQGIEIRRLNAATTGLGLLQIRETVRGEGFHLGEFSLSTAAVELSNGSNQTAQGGAAICGDDEQLIHRLAVCDAILSAGWAGSQQLEELIQEGDEVLRQQSEIRHRILASTLVNFARLGDET